MLPTWAVRVRSPARVRSWKHDGSRRRSVSQGRSSLSPSGSCADELVVADSVAHRAGRLATDRPTGDGDDVARAALVGAPRQRPRESHVPVKRLARRLPVTVEHSRGCRDRSPESTSCVFGAASVSVDTSYAFSCRDDDAAGTANDEPSVARAQMSTASALRTRPLSNGNRGETEPSAGRRRLRNDTPHANRPSYLLDVPSDTAQTRSSFPSISKLRRAY